jgi:hypothetical protein
MRTQRRRYVFEPEEGLCIVLARLSTVRRWREMEQVFYRSGGAFCEKFYFVISIFFSQFSLLLRFLVSSTVTGFSSRIVSALTLKGFVYSSCTCLGR